MGKSNSPPMTKGLLMDYTFYSLFVIAFTSYVAFGLQSLLLSIITVGVAVLCDILMAKVSTKFPKNTMSAAVFGLIVAMSYTLGETTGMGMFSEKVPAISGEPETYIVAALISAIGLIVFKKLQGLAGRKYVNPAAISKLLVLGLLFMPVLMPTSHSNGNALNLQNPLTADPFGGPAFHPMSADKFAFTLLGCYGQTGYIFPSVANYISTGVMENSLPDVLNVMLVAKYHGWVGGFSSILVIAMGIVLFALARGYIKWRITATYFVATAVMSFLMYFMFGGDPILRLVFHLFVGSSIFMAFFMATDPATTPITRLGQIIFGLGLGILTVAIQTFTGFLGGSILALVIMNLTCPVLDKVGVPKAGEQKPERKLPEAKQFVATETYDCLRCGACLNVCHKTLSPILIKEATNKRNVKALMTMKADYCTGCRTCNFVCPAGINLESYTPGYPLQKDEITKIEQQFLKGTADEDIGVYSELFAAKSSIKGQDGGVATALLVSGMKKGMFDAAIVVKRTDGYFAEAVIAENADEVAEGKGTKYLRIPLVSKLEELLEKGKRKIAIVGMACEVRAARRIQQVLLETYPDLELTVIGLFCYECFDYFKLKEETAKLMDVDLDSVEKTQIQKGKFIVQVKGTEKSISVKDLNKAVEGRCLDCPDFSAEYADISVGSVGSDEGYSTVIVRSDVGKVLFESLNLAKTKADKEEIAKLSVLKKKRAKLNRYGA